MNETEQQIREREYEANLQKLQELRPIDDEFMRCMFKDNIPLAELVLRIITGKPFEDGEHILYVNGEYRGDSEIGKLMHDFNCADAKDMYFDLMAERTEYLKKNPEGVKKMSKIGEEIAIMAAIRTYRECNIDDATIIERIKERFQVTNEAAVEYVKDKCLV